MVTLIGLEQVKIGMTATKMTRKKDGETINQKTDKDCDWLIWGVGYNLVLKSDQILKKIVLFLVKVKGGAGLG